MRPTSLRAFGDRMSGGPSLVRLGAWALLSIGLVMLGAWGLSDGLTTHEFGHAYRHTTPENNAVGYWLAVLGGGVWILFWSGMTLVFGIIIVRRLGLLRR